MDNIVFRTWHDLLSRAHGFMTFRLILQPLAAGFFGVRAGLKDARVGRPAYFWSLFGHQPLRPELLKEGFHDLSRVILFAVVMDLLYQLKVFHWFYPFQTAMVVVVLAILPYLLLRGPVSRMAKVVRDAAAQRQAHP